jgi:2-dehydro-3-deoxyphosphooctonate aldolase (KDO 8-P synthase)
MRAGRVVLQASFDKANRSNPGCASRIRACTRGWRRSHACERRLDSRVDRRAPSGASARRPTVVDVPADPSVPLAARPICSRAAGADGQAVNVKKGQWMAPEAMKGCRLEKVPDTRGQGSEVRSQRHSTASHHHSAPAPLPVTERKLFRICDLAVDMRSIHVCAAALAAPVIFRRTHSVHNVRADWGARGRLRKRRRRVRFMSRP